MAVNPLKNMTASRNWQAALMRPVPALPVDLFRVLVGLLSLVYMLRLTAEVRDISAPDGLIDHALLQEVFWFLRLSLFQPGIQTWHFYLVYLVGAAAAGLVVIGWRPRLAALVLYLIAVSSYRWNFLVLYLDDGLMHLAIAWLLLLPTGRTLVLRAWLREGPAAWSRWKSLTVPGGAVRLFLANLALIYLTAGLWKWTSPMWLDGSALYAGLRMPISLAPGMWRPEYLPWLTLATYGALVLEPLLALMVVLPKHHPLKYLLALGAVGLHGGIILTMNIAFANFVCLFGLVLIMREEIMAVLNPGRVTTPVAPASRLDRSGKLALVIVALLTLAMAGDVLPWWRQPSGLSRQMGPDGRTLPPGQVLENIRSQSGSGIFVGAATYGNPAYLPLWLMGLAQTYRLFDWIDEVNFTAGYTIVSGADTTRGDEAMRALFPASSRGAALQGFANDIRWVVIPPSYSDALKTEFFERLARRYCLGHPSAGRVEVYVTVERITRDNPDLNQAQSERFMDFSCQAGEPQMHYMRLSAGS